MFKLVRDIQRFSQTSRPEVGQIYTFDAESPLMIAMLSVIRPYPNYQGRRCRVIKNEGNTVNALFSGECVSDLVSPEFLVERGLTKLGKALLE